MLDLFRGAHYMIRGFQLIWQPGLRRYTVIPLLINALLFAGILVFGAHLFDQWITGLLASVPSWLQWLDWLLWILFVAAGAIIAFFTFTLVANLIGAPFNDLLAKSVEEYLTGHKTSATPGTGVFFREIIISFTDGLKKLFYFLLRAAPVLLLFVIPVANTVAPIVWIIFTSWMLALEYLDYPLSNHGIAFANQRQSLRGKRELTFGFGGAVLVATSIPLLNFLVMPAAVAGATALYVDRLAAIVDPADTPRT